MQQGDVGLLVFTDLFGCIFTAILQVDLDLVRLVNHVGVGDHVTLLGIDDDTGAERLERLLAHLFVGHVGAEEELELFRQTLAGNFFARNRDIDHCRGDLFENRRQAWHLLI